MTDNKTLIRALRCAAGVYDHKCRKDCPYYEAKAQNEVERFSEYHADGLSRCDVGGVMIDAANRLEIMMASSNPFDHIDGEDDWE